MPTVRYIGWGVGNEVLTTLLSYINGHVIMLLKKLKFHFQTWGAELQTILGLMATLWWRINLHSTWYNIEIFIRLMLHKLRNKGNSVVPRYTMNLHDLENIRTNYMEGFWNISWQFEGGSQQISSFWGKAIYESKTMGCINGRLLERFVIFYPDWKDQWFYRVWRVILSTYWKNIFSFCWL